MATAPKKVKAKIYTTPEGVFRFPSLIKVDYGTEEYPKPAGQYKTGLILSEEEAAPLVKLLTPLHLEAVAEGEEKFAKLGIAVRKKLKELSVNDFFTPEYDKETEEPTGNLIFSFKSTFSGVRKDGTKWQRKLNVFDAQGDPLKAGVDVWGGTRGVIAFSTRPYFVDGTGTAGLSLSLEAVQIIELVQGGQRGADSFGFSARAGFSNDDVESAEEEKPAFPSGDNDAADGDY